MTSDGLSVSQEVGRLSGLLQYRYHGDYSSIRHQLTAKTWELARKAIENEFYLTFATFPAWTSPDGMLDFEPLWGRFPISDFRTICVRFARAPIDDTIADSVFELISEPVVQRVRTGGSQARDASPTSGESDLRELPLGALLTSIVSDAALERSLLVYGEVNCETPIVSCQRTDVAVTILRHIAASANSELILAPT